MNTKNRLRTSLVLAGVLAAGVAGAASVPAQAHPAPAKRVASIAVGSGTAPAQTASSEAATQTRLTLSRPMRARLARTHISLTTTGAASMGVHDGVTTLRFPVKSYNQHGTPLTHRGGITFRRGSVDVHLDHLQLRPRKGQVVATIEHDARAPFARVATDRHGVVRVMLNRLMAGQLNATFGTHRFAGGQRFGTLRPTRLPGSGAAESITVHVTNTTRWTLDLDKVDTGGMGTVTQRGDATLKPGDNADIVVESGGTFAGVQATITYLIDGTSDKTTPAWTIESYFQVPILGGNENRCSQGRQVDYRQCSIGHGYQAKANWEPAMTSSSPVLDFGGSGTVWMFRKAESISRGVAIDGGSDADAARASLWTLSGQTKNERWTWVPSADYAGYGQLVNLESGKCLEHNESNGNVDQWPCADTGNMLWRPTYNSTDNATNLQLLEEDNGEPQYLGLDTDPTSAGEGSAIVLVHTPSNRTSWYPNQMN